ncbi:MAG: Flp pilus assembly complex ATPase component TadA, partial [Acidaminococcaceae bacterium]|nr:Flp pilus assembly complex ATPase component TadA [Acidaminococcaceae bacterium]
GGLRSILRQDPNVIMIGEIRDRETAEISIQAALTGHLVFSTLHTNTAAGAVIRLLDMGIEPYLAASALQGIVAQRLVRTLCSNCRQTYVPEENAWERKYLQKSLGGQRLPLYKAAGCAACHQSGYKGRLAIHELLPVNAVIKSKIMKRVSEQELWETAKSEYPNLTTLEEDGLRKAREGLTAAEELLRVLGV